MTIKSLLNGDELWWWGLVSCHRAPPIFLVCASAYQDGAHLCSLGALPSRLFHACLSHFKPFPRLLFPTLIRLEVKVLSDDCLSAGGICYQLNLGDSCQHVCPGEIIVIIFLLIFLLIWSDLSSFSSSAHIAQPLLLVFCFWILFWFSQFASPCLHTLYTNSYHSRVLKNINLIYCQR